MILELKDGPTLPGEVVELALRIEGRGFTLIRVGEDGLRVSPVDDSIQPLSDGERTEIKQWKQHLLALIDYCNRDQ